jgi:hydroxymethylpyrimidine pyrophosphatase-like HAD family hydrolase
MPAVTLNTGRPSPYVEAVMQAIDGWQPALYESGAGMYFPHTYQFKTTPLLAPEQAETLQEIVAALDKELVRKGRAYWQPGKTVCYTLFAHEPLTPDDILPEARAVVAEMSSQFMVTPAILALNIHPSHINKGTGLQWLAQETGIDPAEMGGVGDSTADVDFLQLVQYPAAPANATAEVKKVVGYVSPQKTAAGLHDILDHWQLEIP